MAGSFFAPRIHLFRDNIAGSAQKSAENADELEQHERENDPGEQRFLVHPGRTDERCSASKAGLPL
jgi:hypothetical protein